MAGQPHTFVADLVHIVRYCPHSVTLFWEWIKLRTNLSSETYGRPTLSDSVPGACFAEAHLIDSGWPPFARPTPASGPATVLQHPHHGEQCTLTEGGKLFQASRLLLRGRKYGGLSGHACANGPPSCRKAVPASVSPQHVLGMLQSRMPGGLGHL